MMTEADTDNSGYIDYTEFIIATMNKKRMLSKKNLGLAFAAFDNDCSGSISVDELRAMLGVRSND
jgi:calcium-dependent protein kinase